MNEVINEIELRNVLDFQRNQLKDNIEQATLIVRSIYKDTKKFDEKQCIEKTYKEMLETFQSFYIVENTPSFFTIQSKKKYSCEAKILLEHFNKKFNKELFKFINLIIRCEAFGEIRKEKYIFGAEEILKTIYNIAIYILGEWKKNKLNKIIL